MKPYDTSRLLTSRGRHLLSGILCLLAAVAARAEDWGAYALVPVSAPAMVLEATGGGGENAIVSIGKSANTPNQRWVIMPKGDSFFAIKPAWNSPLALSVAKAGAANGSAIVLSTDTSAPAQLWTLSKHEDGSYSLIPKHAPTFGLDDFGGKSEPGSRIDLWEYHADDPHLHWFIRPLAGSTALAVAPDEAAKAYVPPDIKPEEIRAGTIKQFTFKQSAIFPGTVRDVTVFIPAQYDAAKPACVYVKTDGYNAAEKTVMETMIATKEMPVTVGVFVRPGDLPAPMKGTQGRRNRCLEYDGVTDDNVRFFTAELLPFVAKEYQLNLSTDGNDRCISGGSSGGITAFTAAWLRPEAFSRVYAASGSFVAFRGGHEFPTLVRKFEAKPIRAFLTTGTHDMENCAGDWFLLDQEMDKALKFSGYDYVFRIINGGHVAGYMDNYREAMAYLWKGWPERVKAGPSAPRARDVLVPDEGWQMAANGLRDTRGPASNAAGEVFFTDPASDKILRIDLDGKVKDFVTGAGRACGVTVGADGQLYSVSEQSEKVMSYESTGKSQVVLDGIRGHLILAHPGGGFYVSSDGGSPFSPGQVWWCKDGHKTLVDFGPHATGLALRPDQWLLAVADGQSKWAYSYQVFADGTLANRERFFWLHVADWDDNAGAESMCYALEGQLFVATRIGVQICADDGPTQVILPVPDHERVLGVCLGGQDHDTLFAFCGDKIWKRKVKVHATGAFTPWTKVVGTKL